MRNTPNRDPLEVQKQNPLLSSYADSAAEFGGGLQQRGDDPSRGSIATKMMMLRSNRYGGDVENF